MTPHLRRVLVLLLLVLAPIPVAARPAWACSCATGFDPLEQAEVAFVGVADQVDPDWFGSEVEVEFSVESVLKGRPGDTVTLVTMKDSASCGYEFVEGGQYRVYASGGQTWSCDGNELLSAGHGGGDRTRTVFWGGTVFVLLVVAGGVTWLIRRS
ncbi:hypothetical protein Aph02nite_68590 [Actinoplanes philippinensis]|uniref:Tissue inhibitor of metalloproteinase n=1 Tax=Actinoplanes philippinensis TaxID=35752 RepID=A0A1I2KPH9_9ACTN|nr:hypothetical protein [Actinoplanes philippinensis]GIE80909.1 hypothetical protein Aph02nite_68590 [Actinoplanes philippinensis]SFF68140.1 hypothetical protein SAMN05421541_117176 [Actinoplanes philippinensis]